LKLKNSKQKTILNENFIQIEKEKKILKNQSYHIFKLTNKIISKFNEFQCHDFLTHLKKLDEALHTKSIPKEKTCIALFEKQLLNTRIKYMDLELKYKNQFRNLKQENFELTQQLLKNQKNRNELKRLEKIEIDFKECKQELKRVKSKQSMKCLNNKKRKELILQNKEFKTKIYQLEQEKLRLQKHRKKFHKVKKQNYECEISVLKKQIEDMENEREFQRKCNLFLAKKNILF
jgi:hypothetical protein